MGLIFSRKYFISSLLLFLNWNFLQVSAIIPQERGDQDCVFMPTVAKIYCYGGQYYSSVTDALSNTAVMDTLFISLDLTEQRTVADLQNAWERVDRDIGPNSFFGFAGLPNHNIIFMDGGAGGIDGGRTKVRYKSATFDIEPNNDWSSVTPERPGTPVNGHKATLGPDNSTIYVWGGLRNNETGVAMGEDTHPLSMYIFDITNTQSPWTTGPAAPESYQYHAAVLVDSSIYYTGGTYRTPSGLIDYVPMNIVRIYDTSNGQWSTHPITGSVIPTTRVRHTTTLKPSTGEVILFGGRGAGKTCNDKYLL
ncbi:hypothetical protein BDA99DRAFT_184135 [Phascolomyces articulosus]|uniref:Galactose oxidase n=1 Tax=Phascolomyces articulosus TaxID=60185 RepID=A0AAD5JS71_9FUNG|nr:hypothetical protein BDA99DRAFT_184135 [Phascolomyces articulosus]